jgi:hypothetical protein
MKTKKREGYLGGLHITYLGAMLKIAIEEKSFTQLWKKHPMKHKQSFLKYLDFCLDRKLINYRSYYAPATAPSTSYQTTERGKMLLRILLGK